MSNTGTILANAFAHDRFTARRKFFNLLAQQFHFYDSSGRMIAYVKQKAFKIKEDIRVYSDESQSRELLTIKARSIMDFSTAYDVMDHLTGQKAGALKRKGLKSLFRDEWILMDQHDRELGRIKEESAVVATIRRWIPLAELIPQSFVFEVGGRIVAKAEQQFNPFVLIMNVDASEDTQRVLDRRLLAAGVVLLLAVEGRQD